MMELNECLRTARILKKMSQTEAAEEIGVSQNTISRWEIGASTPDALSLIAMHSVYGVTIDQLCGVEPF